MKRERGDGGGKAGGDIGRMEGGKVGVEKFSAAVSSATCAKERRAELITASGLPLAPTLPRYCVDCDCYCRE